MKARSAHTRRSQSSRLFVVCSKGSNAFSLLASVILLISAVSKARAADWDGQVDGSWLNALNWAADVLPATGDNILFPSVVNQTIDLGAAQSIGSLTFNSGNPYTLNNFTLTLGGDVTQSGAGAVNIFSGLDTGGSARMFSGAGSGEVTVGGIFSGAGAVTFAGGNFTLTNAANSFSSGSAVSITGGRLTLSTPLNLSLNSAAGAASQIGAGNITISGGELRLLPGTGGTVGSIGRPVTFGANGGVLNYAGNPGNGVALSLVMNSGTTPA